MQVTHEQAQEVVRAGNIGEVSQVLRQPGNGLSLQTGHITDDDHCAAFAAGGRPENVFSGARARQEYVVTIYSQTGCRLFGVVREGELLGR